MSEIEKMYRAAKVVPSHHYCNECQYDMSAECPIRCPDNVAVYPPFTAEKQIEITRKLWEFRPNIYPNFDLLVNHSYGEMIATFVNNLWQSLTGEEREQIREILK